MQLHQNTLSYVDTWQHFHQNSYYVVVGGDAAAVTVLKAVWEGMKWIGNVYYDWRKGKDKELQKELKKAGKAQTHDRFWARPPVLQNID